jgi:hypothetical protein
MFLIVIGLCAVLSLFAPRAGATTFCVGSVEELNAAFDTAFSDNTSDEIRLLIGYYAPSSTLRYYANAANGDSLVFSGGWISLFNSCDVQLPDASLTEIDGSGVASLAFQMQGSAPASLYVSNFSLLNPGTTENTSSGLTFSAPASPSMVPSLYIGNVIVRSCTNQALDCGILVFGSTQVVIRNTLVADNDGERSIGISINGNTLGSVVMNHVTVADNHSYGLGTPGIYINTAGNITISNSVLWGNTGQLESTTCDLAAVSAYAKVINTNIGKTCSPYLVGSANVSNADPLFAGSGNYRLKPASPARDSGVANPIGGLINVDLDGHARTIGALPDRGAYELEDKLFENGFE